jgi:4-O-beta-D-mannosyl-D-glucose phosphorylase
LSAAIARCGIARTKDLVKWERLPDLKTPALHQRNCVLHPEFVNGKYAFYTRPMSDFAATGSGDGIGWGLCDDITNAEVKKESIIDPRFYHTSRKARTASARRRSKRKKGWLHLAHGVRNTAAGMRYVLYVFLCDLKDPAKQIKPRPGGISWRRKMRSAWATCPMWCSPTAGWRAQRRRFHLLRLLRHAHACRDDDGGQILDYVTNTPPDANALEIVRRAALPAD